MIDLFEENLRDLNKAFYARDYKTVYEKLTVLRALIIQIREEEKNAM